MLNIGTISVADTQNYSLTGVLARCVGIKRDVRLSVKNTYSGYQHFFFKSFLGLNGDSYDRFLLRMFEMGESLNISSQCINAFNKFVNGDNTKQINFLNFTSIALNSKKVKSNVSCMYTYMEDLIEHFLSWHSGVQVNSNLSAAVIESPKGEFGVSLVSDQTNKPFRCKIRSPSYSNLQFLPKLVKGHLLADLATIIGTIDIVFGEIDK